MFLVVIVQCGVDVTFQAFQLDVKQSYYESVVFHQVGIEQGRDGIVGLHA